MRRGLFVILMFVTSVLQAQVSDVIPQSASIAGTDDARTDEWTAFHNPATLVQESRWQAAAQYENRFLTAELSTVMVQTGWCNRYVNVGLGYSFFGYGGWNEMMATLVLARRFGRFSIGLASDFIAVYAGNDLGYRCTAVPQMGVTVNLLPVLTLGIQAYNPFLQTLPAEYGRRNLPSIYTLAIDWRINPSMRWDVQGEYAVNVPWRVATGFEWQVVEQVGLKIGLYYQQYVIPCIGIGLHFGSLRIDMNSELHPVLGVNLLGCIGYVWK